MNRRKGKEKGEAVKKGRESRKVERKKTKGEKERKKEKEMGFFFQQMVWLEFSALHKLCALSPPYPLTPTPDSPSLTNPTNKTCSLKWKEEKGTRNYREMETREERKRDYSARMQIMLETKISLPTIPREPTHV